MKPPPNAKPVSQDLEHAFCLFWGIGRVYNLCGFYMRIPRFERAKFPTRDTKPTEKECRAALARILMFDKVPPQLLRELAAAIHPEENYIDGANRRIKFEKINQGHRDAHRDITIAVRVFVAMKQDKDKSRDEACAEVAKLAGLSFERTRDIYDEHRARLSSVMDEAVEGARKRSAARIR
jgi:hypothetical protein